MMVITRRSGERIIIGNGDVIIRLIERHGNFARLGIIVTNEAPIAHVRNAQPSINLSPAFKASSKKNGESLQQLLDKKNPGYQIFELSINEWIKIGGNIGIKISELRGQQARIAIEAPRSISIQREENFRANKKTEQTQPINEGPGGVD